MYGFGSTASSRYSTGYPLYGSSSIASTSAFMGNRQGRAGAPGGYTLGTQSGGGGGELASAASFVPADDSDVIVDRFKTGLSPVRASTTTTGAAAGSYARQHAAALGSRPRPAAAPAMADTYGQYGGAGGGYSASSYASSSSSSATASGQPQQQQQQRASSSAATTRRSLLSGLSSSSNSATTASNGVGVGVGPSMDRYGSSSSSGLRRPSSGQFASSSSSSSSSSGYDYQQPQMVTRTRTSERNGIGFGTSSSSSATSSSSSSQARVGSASSMLPPTSARTRLLPQQSEMTVPEGHGLKGGNPASSSTTTTSSSSGGVAVPGTVTRRAVGTGALAFDGGTSARRVPSSSSLGIGPGVLDGLPASLTSKAANAAAGIVSVSAMREVAANTAAAALSSNQYSTSTRGNNVTTHYYQSDNRPINSSGSYKLPVVTAASTDHAAYYSGSGSGSGSARGGGGGIGGRQQYVDDDDDDGGGGYDDDDQDADDIYNKVTASSSNAAAGDSRKFLVSSRAYPASSSSSSSASSSSASASSSAAAAAVAQQKAALLARSNQMMMQQQQQQQQQQQRATASSSKYQDSDEDEGDDDDDDDEEDENYGRGGYRPQQARSATTSTAAATAAGGRSSGAGAMPLAPSSSSSSAMVRKPQQPSPYASSPRGLVGLMNLGNTCFMNSCLQCVSNVPPLTDLFLAGSGAPALHINRNAATSRTRGEVASAWAELMSRFWGRSSSGSGVESPSRIKKIVGTVASRFLGYDQQDSQEFLVFLLDSLMDDTNTIPGKPPYKELSEKPEQSDVEIANEWWRYYGERCDSRVRDLITGQLKTLVRCESCGHLSRAFDPFNTLALPIPKSAQVGGDECSLTECFRAFTSPEVLSGSEAHYCSRCKTHRTCTKTMTLFRLPPVLILQLKRFTFSTFRRTKLTTSVKFPVQDLDINGERYDCVAVSNHSGSLGGGHYTADALNRDDKQWYHFNDSHVSGTTPRHLSGSAAYLLFYVRKDLL